MKRKVFSVVLFVSLNSLFAQITSCFNATPICGDNITISNSTGTPSYGIVSCMGSSPNPSWFIFKVDASGDFNFQLSQGNNSPNYNNLDIDYVLWGPFSDLPDCSTELYDFPTGNTAISNNLVSCSFSASSVENFSLPNAQSGEFYVVLSTNYSSLSGEIWLQQTNAGLITAGTLVCDYVIINLQPSNQVFTPSGSASFSVASNNATTFKWEMSTNLLDWAPLNDGGTMPVISGSDTSVLNLSNIPSSYSGYYFRVLATNANDAIYSKNSQLTEALNNNTFSSDIAIITYTSDGGISIVKSETFQFLDYRIIDMNGRLILQNKIEEENYNLPLSQFHKGIYFLELKSGDKKMIKKIYIK